MSAAMEYDLAATYGDVLRFKVVRVHDGDTLIVNVPHWPRPFRTIEVRLFGWDAPELDDPRPDIATPAQKARQRLVELAADLKKLSDLRHDKFFRLDADFKTSTGDVGIILSSEGLLRPYSGQGPKPW